MDYTIIQPKHPEKGVNQWLDSEDISPRGGVAQDGRARGSAGTGGRARGLAGTRELARGPARAGGSQRTSYRRKAPGFYSLQFTHSCGNQFSLGATILTILYKCIVVLLFTIRHEYAEPAINEAKCRNSQYYKRAYL
jgi:hypothetical protein